MNKHFITVIFIAILSGVLNSGCHENVYDISTTTTRTVQFTGAQGDCTKGGTKIEIIVNGEVDDAQTQYICNDKSEQQESCDSSCKDNQICQNGTCTNANVGDVIVFGRYEQDNDATNGEEPITWRILDKNSSSLYLIISEKILDVKSYNVKRYNVKHADTTWEKSTIRSWLNGYDASYNTYGNDYTSENFIDTAFSAREKAKIIASNVPAHKNPKFSTSPGNDTMDKIFLLSIVEVENYFANDTDRKADTTRYSAKKLLYVYGSESGEYRVNVECTDVHCYSEWWLRSPGVYTYSVANVDYYGYVFLAGDSAHNRGVGVRPAMWVQF